MSPSALHIKSEEIDTAEKRQKYTVGIIGQDQTDVLYAYLFAEAGFKVTYANPDQAIVNLLVKGRALCLRTEIESKLKVHIRNGHLVATNDIKSAVSQSDIVAIAFSAKTDERKAVDYSQLESTCKIVGSNLRCGSLVIVLGVMGLGINENVVRKILEDTSGLNLGTDLGLAYVPQRVVNGSVLEGTASHELMVAASEKNSLNAASTILAAIARKGVIKTEKVRTAEAVALFQAAREQVNAALTDEFRVLCEKAGLDYFDICKLLDSQEGRSNSSSMFTGENVQTETCILLDSAENVAARLRIPSIAAEVNDETIKHAANLAQNAMRECGKALRRARIALLGVTQIPNMRSPPKAVLQKLVETLTRKGARVSIYDPYLTESALEKMTFPFKKSLTEVIENADCVVILTAHDQFRRLNLNKLKLIMKMPAAIVDLEGAVEPDKVEKEGFIYRGFGRGVWKK